MWRKFSVKNFAYSIHSQDRLWTMSIELRASPVFAVPTVLVRSWQSRFLAVPDGSGVVAIGASVDGAICHDTIGLYAKPGCAGNSAYALALAGAPSGRPKTAI